MELIIFLLLFSISVLFIGTAKTVFMFAIFICSSLLFLCLLHFILWVCEKIQDEINYKKSIKELRKWGYLPKDML